MKRLFIVALVGGLVLAAGLLASLGTDREPQWRGVTLTDWLKRALAETEKHRNPKELETDPEWVACRAAILEMGARSIPFLLADLQKQDSKFRAHLVGWSRKPRVAAKLSFKTSLWLQNYLVSDMIDTALRHRRALLGFEILGPAAASADPALLKLIGDADPDQRFWALNALAGTQPPREVFMPPAVHLLKDPDKSVQIDAATRIIELFPDEAEALHLYKAFPQLLYLRPKPAPPPIGTGPGH